MLVDPHILVHYAIPILCITIAILLGQSLFGSLGYLLSGQTLRNAMRCGFSMAQIGEFAFIIASLGLSLGVISDFLYPVVVAVSVITTFLTPYMIRAAEPSYKLIEKRLSEKWIRRMNHLWRNNEHHVGSQQSKTKDNWHHLLVAMTINTVIYSILSIAVMILMFTFALPLLREMLPGWNLHWYANAICGVLTVILISPFLRAIVVKKNRSMEFRALWTNRLNRLPLLFTIFVRIVLAAAFVFYIVNYLSRFTNALIAAIALVAVALMVLSRQLKHRSIKLERMFIQNLRSRDTMAQVSGRKRPLYEGHLLDRDIHISEFEIPEDSLWGGQRLDQLRIGSRFGVHVSSILRGKRRINIPGGDTQLFPGDVIQVIGDDKQLTAMGTSLKNEQYMDDPLEKKPETRLRQLILTSDSPFVGKTLRDSGIRDRYNCMVVGIEKGQENLTLIDPSHQFMAGDIIWVVGEEEALEKITS
jgi:CPA2 family monovalent cation:H+ antiporter-2